jgi:hypothetical protein
LSLHQPQALVCLPLRPMQGMPSTVNSTTSGSPFLPLGKSDGAGCAVLRVDRMDHRDKPGDGENRGTDYGRSGGCCAFLFSPWPGMSRPSGGARAVLVERWVPGSSPGMTSYLEGLSPPSRCA